MTESIPRYRFALLGLRRAGKTVFLASLDAMRRPELDGAVISCIGAWPAGDPSLDATAPKTRESALFERIRDNARGLEAGKVPAETDTADGIVTYRFHMTLQKGPLPGASSEINIDLLDYAGELLRPVTDEAELRQRLHDVVSETDGLLVLAEAPPPRDCEADLVPVQPLRDLLTALDKLHDDEPGAFSERAAALLVTKWDRCHLFQGTRHENERETDYLHRLGEEEAGHRRLFDEWLAEDGDAASVRDISHKLRGAFTDADFTAWPCSAFGAARRVSHDAADGYDAEVSATSPLASLNLLAPLHFLIDRARYHHRTALESLSPEEPPALADLPTPETVTAEQGNDEALLAHLDALRSAAAEHEAAGRRKRLRRQAGKWFTGVALVALIAAVAVDRYRGHATDVTRQAVAIALGGDDLDAVISAQERLAQSQAGASWLAPGLPEDEARLVAGNLTTRECELWALRAAQGTIDTDLARARQQLLPQCEGLDQALALVAVNEWKVTLRGEMDSLRRVTSYNLCTDPRFLRGDAESAFTEVENILTYAPAGADKSEIAGWHNEAQELLDACLVQSQEAESRAEFDRIRRKLDNQDWAGFLHAAGNFLNGRPEDTRRLELVRPELSKMPELIVSWIDGSSDPATYVRELTALLRDIDAFKGQQPDLSGETDALRNAVSSAIESGKRAAMCRHVGEVVSLYDNMRRGSLQERNPAAEAKLSKAATRLAQDSETSRLAEELIYNIRKGRNLTVRSLTIRGEFPEKSGDSITAEFVADGRRSRIEIPGHDKTKDLDYQADFDHFNLGSADSIVFGLLLEQDDWGNNTFLSGQSTTTREELFGGMTAHDTVLIGIAVAVREGARSLIEMTPAKAYGGESLKLELQLSAPDLPQLRQKPSCPAN